MNSVYKKFSLFHYNIGFFDFNQNNIFFNRKINWLKHSYKDRFFADPFILDVRTNVIKVLVEEFSYKEWKGKISLLTIDKETFILKEIKVLLDIDTHLSFPFIFRNNKDIYVIPENSASGSLNIYKYDSKSECLSFEKKLINEPIIDPVLFKKNNSFILFGTIRDKKENKDLYAWESNELFGDYVLKTCSPIISSAKLGRRGGDFFEYENNLFSVSQNCLTTYGESLNICKITNLSSTDIKESLEAVITPDQNYSEGLHTFNCYKNICVVDGLTYLFSPFRKIKRVISLKAKK